MSDVLFTALTFAAAVGMCDLLYRLGRRHGRQAVELERCSNDEVRQLLNAAAEDGFRAGYQACSLASGGDELAVSSEVAEAQRRAADEGRQ